MNKKKEIIKEIDVDWNAEKVKAKLVSVEKCPYCKKAIETYCILTDKGEINEGLEPEIIPKDYYPLDVQIELELVSIDKNELPDFLTFCKEEHADKWYDERWMPFLIKQSGKRIIKFLKKEIDETRQHNGD